MAIKDALPVTVEGSVAAGAAVDIRRAATVSAYLSGTFVATVQWEVSPDGVVWVAAGAAQTAPGVVTITTPAFWLRANTTAYTSGTPAGALIIQTV